MQWSTYDIPQHDRFDFWRESICAAFDPMSPELAASERGGFSGEIGAWALGEAVLMEIRATGHVTGRSPQDIAHGNHDLIYLYRQRAAAWFDMLDGTGFATGKGAVVIGHADRAFGTGVMPGHDFDHVVLKLPRRLLEPMLAGSQDIATTVISAERGIGALLASYFDSFIAEAPALAADEARVALDCLGSLAASAYGAIRPDHDPRTALRLARLAQARRVIEHCLDGAALSPDFVARAVGISVRALHRLFEPTGTTFSRHVQRRRLDLACRRLAHTPHETVLQIALDCGFGSLATFYRAFSEAHGVSPAAYRARHMARDSLAPDGKQPVAEQ